MACGMYRGEELCIQGYNGETEGKRPPGRDGGGWEDNIKLDVQDTELEAYRLD